MLRKAIQSAITNAKTVLKVDESALSFKTLTVEQGNKMKRYKAGGRGTAKPFVRQFAHIKVVLVAKVGSIQTRVKALPQPTDKKEANTIKKPVVKKVTAKSKK